MKFDKDITEIKMVNFLKTQCIYTVFHKNSPFFFLSYFTQIIINWQEIFISCSWRNINSKYFNKIWQL